MYYFFLKPLWAFLCFIIFNCCLICLDLEIFPPIDGVLEVEDKERVDVFDDELFDLLKDILERNDIGVIEFGEE